jgi:hypothetical protein
VRPCVRRFVTTFSSLLDRETSVVHSRPQGAGGFVGAQVSRAGRRSRPSRRRQRPVGMIPTGFEPEHDDTTEGKLGHVESLMNHLDTLVRGGADNVVVKREHTETHNMIQLLWYAMARSCGCGNVKMEDVAFDRGPWRCQEGTLALPAVQRSLAALAAAQPVLRS